MGKRASLLLSALFVLGSGAAVLALAGCGAQAPNAGASASTPGVLTATYYYMPG